MSLSPLLSGGRKSLVISAPSGLSAHARLHSFRNDSQRWRPFLLSDCPPRGVCREMRLGSKVALSRKLFADGDQLSSLRS